MKKYLKIILLLTCVSTGIANAQQADIIITNGKISTMDAEKPEVQAVAISKNKIVLTGTNADVLKLKSANTKLIDAKGSRVIPGLFDTHVHVIREGRFYNSELRWDGVKTLKRALQMLKEQAQRTPKGQWVRVIGGWNEHQFAEKRLPTMQEINEATGEVPTLLMYLYTKGWLNKSGLAALNITKDTPNPIQGRFERDANGNPTGYMIAEPNATILYSTLAKLPSMSTEEETNSTLQYMTELNRLGLTAILDAAGGFQSFPDDYSVMNKLHEEGKITMRMPFYLFAQKKGTELADYTRWVGMVHIDEHTGNGHNDIEYHVAGGGENLVMDAADFENFHYTRPELPESMESNLKPVISLLVKNKWPFRLHATYDESITRFLNVIEEVNKETPFNGLLWFLDHGETISEENLKCVKALGGGMSIQNRLSFQGEAFTSRYGEALAGQAPPVKKMLEMGIPVGFGTDGTRVSSYNPWVGIYWLHTGKTVGGFQVMAKENTLDRKTILELATFKGYELIREPSKGKIKNGYYADVVILDRDYFNVGEEDIKNITSKLTIVDGKVVYGNSEHKKFAPAALPIIPEWSPVKYYGGYQTK